MNIKLIGATIILICLLTFFYIRFPKEYASKSNSTNITELSILKYIPKDSDIKIISNFRNPKLNKDLNRIFSNKNISNLKMIKESIINLIGLEFNNDFYDIYDNEFSLSVSNIKSDKKDVLLIVKMKENNLNKKSFSEDNITVKDLSDFEISSLFKYSYLTDDNYIILSNDKSYLQESIRIKNNLKIKDERKKILDQIPYKLKSENILLISTSDFLNDFFKEPYTNKSDNLITTISLKEDHINLKSFLISSFDFSDVKQDNLLDNQERNINLIYSNNAEKFMEDSSLFSIDPIQESLYRELNQNSFSNILFLNNGPDWLIGFPKKDLKGIKIGDLNILKKYNMNNLNVNETNYSVWFRSNLDYDIDQIILKEEDKLFSSESNNLIIISNSLKELTQALDKENLKFRYLIHGDNKIRKSSIEDMVFMSNIDQGTIRKNYPIFNMFKYFSGNYLKLSIENIKAIIKQEIPNLNPEIYIETDIKLI